MIYRFAPLALLLLLGCGGPEGPGDPKIGPDGKPDICAKNSGLLDTDHDGASDECEINQLHTPPDDPDCDNDDIPDSVDDPKDCDTFNGGPGPEDECTGQCLEDRKKGEEERRNSWTQDPDFRRGMVLGTAAAAGAAPFGSSVVDIEQRMVFGDIRKVIPRTDGFFQPRIVRYLAKMQNQECQKPNSIFLLLNGTVTLNNQTSPTWLELCGELLGNANLGGVSDLTAQKLELQWRVGYVHASSSSGTLFSWKLLDIPSESISTKQTFTKLRLSRLDTGIYRQLNWELESAYSFYAFPRVDQGNPPDVDVRIEKIAREWKRSSGTGETKVPLTGTNSQAPYSQYFLGLWFKD